MTKDNINELKVIIQEIKNDGKISKYLALKLRDFPLCKQPTTSGVWRDALNRQGTTKPLEKIQRGNTSYQNKQPPTGAGRGRGNKPYHGNFR